MSETERLEAVAHTYQPDGFEALANEASARAVLEHSRGTRCLEIGAGTGIVTRQLATRFDTVTTIEPAARYARTIEALGLPNVEVVQALAEEYTASQPYDTIVLAHVLEHVADPGALLRRAAGMLEAGGVIIAIVPNAGSLHRRVGVAAGLIAHITDLTPADVAIGHRRVYTSDTLRAEIVGAGLTVAALLGQTCKPLSNSQMDTLPAGIQEAFIAIGRQLLPDWANELLAVATSSW
jgi:2-polyprenyl-3-methyl-5-hydroxy-6-metoxy-1,4-benzoquinol methylase